MDLERSPTLGRPQSSTVILHIFHLSYFFVIRVRGIEASPSLKKLRDGAIVLYVR